LHDIKCAIPIQDTCERGDPERSIECLEAVSISRDCGSRYVATSDEVIYRFKRMFLRDGHACHSASSERNERAWDPGYVEHLGVCILPPRNKRFQQVDETFAFPHARLAILEQTHENESAVAYI